jgi:nicotinate-nucleotide pyrophosphorylase
MRQNVQRMGPGHLRYFVTTLMLLMLSGNASSLWAAEQLGINVTSDPSGATVYASGKKLGLTPMFVPAGTFPTKMVNLIYRPVGTLTLKRAGCRTHGIEVSEKVLSKDIHVALECGPAYEVKEHPQPAAPPAPGVGSTARRLRELNKLRDEGLITDEEYRAVRKRILDEI